MTHVNPEADQATDLPAKFINTNQATTDSRGRQLGNVDRSDVRASSNTQTSQDTTSVNQSQATIAIRAQHETSTENKNQTRDKQSDSATPEVSKRVSEEGTKESTSLVAGDNIGTEQVLGITGHGSKIELGLEGVQSQCCANEGAVITDHA